jgi:NADH-quinone oxidoreductase subunit L
MTYPVAADLTLTAAFAATALPLAAFAVILLLTRGFPRVSAALSIAAISVALVCAGALLVRHWHLATPLEYSTLWMAGGDIVVRVGFLIDPLSLLMLMIVAAICFLVQVYSLGIWRGTRGLRGTTPSCRCSPGP